MATEQDLEVVRDSEECIQRIPTGRSYGWVCVLFVKECRLVWLCFAGENLSSVSAVLPALNLNIQLCIGMTVRISPSFLQTTAWYFC